MSDGVKKNHEEPRLVNGDLKNEINLSHLPPGEEIVISGISGTFAESENVNDFAQKLFNKVDLVTPLQRWDTKIPEVPECSGKLPDIASYDAGYFGINSLRADQTDAMSRILQEKTIEAIFDAGIHPADLEGTNTGVFIAPGPAAAEKSWNNGNLVAVSPWAGSIKSLMANEISYFLKLKGPAYSVETACSTSLCAFEHGYNALKSGYVETAIVGSINLVTHPYLSVQSSRLGILSPDGKCKTFDKDGNGFARSEAGVILILQKAKHAKRVYANIVHVKMNSDGFKSTGIAYSSQFCHKDLYEEFYEECQIDPSTLSYMEAHGTGTFVGDPEECAGITDAFTKGRKSPLPIGSVKSNLGHTEIASGLCAIIKCIIALETGYIPPNLNFIEARKEIKGILEGKLKVVTEKMPLEGDRCLIGINNFGFGGSNGHLLLAKNVKEKVNSGIPVDNLPRLICVSGRTSDAVKTLLDGIKHKLDAEYIRLIHSVFRKNVPNHIYRGYTILSKSGELEHFQKPFQAKRPSLFIALGELDNWLDIGSTLMELSPIYNSIHSIQKILIKKEIDIINMFVNRKADGSKYRILGTLVVQIAIIDLLKLLGINPINLVGCVYGEFLSGYQDNILNLEETVNCAVALNEAFNNIQALSDKFRKGTTKFNGSQLAPKAQEMGDINKIKDQLFKDISATLTTDTAEKFHTKFAFIQYFMTSLGSDVTLNIDQFEDNSVLLCIGTIPIVNQCEKDVKIFSSFSKKCENYLIELLKALGQLYVIGHELELAKLYPEVEFPVSRGTQTISSLIKWNHDRKWFVPQYSTEESLKVQRGPRVVHVHLKDPNWTCLKGHIVGGHNVFPCSGYLWMVWETFSLLKKMDMDSMAVVFEDCRFIRTITVPEQTYLNFYVRISSTGLFEITQNDSPVATGTIKLVDTDDEHTEQKDYENFKDMLLKQTDIYKELGLRDYDYSGHFQSIECCNGNASQALIKWNTNWITFMENMIQLKFLQIKSRLIHTPRYIAKLKISAKHHMNWIKKHIVNDDPVSVPVFCNPATHKIRSEYIEMYGIQVCSKPGKQDLNIPILEKYVFVSNFASLKLEESIRVNLLLLLENTLVYKVTSLELIDEFTPKYEVCLSPIIQSVLKDQPLVKALTKVYSTISINTSASETTVGKTSTAADNILIIVSKIFERPQVFSRTLAQLKENGFIISRESKEFNPSAAFDSSVVVVTIHKTPLETLVLLKKRSIFPEPLTVKITAGEDFSWIQVLQECLKNQKNSNILLYAENEPTSGILGLLNCLRKEPDGARIKCVFIMDDSIKFSLNNPAIVEQLNKNLVANVFKNGQWGSYKHLLLNKPSEILCEHCFANGSVNPDISSIRWSEGNLPHKMEVFQGEELVYVNYTALNTNDITSSQPVNNDATTVRELDENCLECMEFSGKAQDGTKVFGFVSSAASTVVVADNYFTIKMPGGMSLEEAATIPIAYAVVIYGLLIRSKLKRGNSILVHSGIKNLGQAAIRIALHYGCQVFTTVGTKEHQKSIRKLFPELQDSHICNLQDSSFEQVIKRETKGKGVDLVLNFLAEERLISSIRCLALGGTMVEIGKYDQPNIDKLNLLFFQKDSRFLNVTLDSIFREESDTKNQIVDELNKGIHEGYIKPFNRKVFKFHELDQAYRYMSTEEHTNKVLIEVKPETKNFDAVPSLYPCIPRYYAYPSKTYVIVGGLGGIGLELAEWLIGRGARNIVLSSRKGITNGYQHLRVRTWESLGVKICISLADVTTKTGCETLLNEAENLGPVDAIFNLAVVLIDAVFENQTKESFKASFGPKAIATFHLDVLSRKLCPTLRAFVIFSSFSCGRGNAGQTNYGMVNSAMERICEKRKEEGYPALAIQLSAIGKVGVIAKMTDKSAEFKLEGTLAQEVSSFLNELDTFLTQNDAVTVSSMIVAEKKEEDVTKTMIDAVFNILALDAKNISIHSPLAELGMESMSAVEIKQTLEREYDVFLSAKDIREMTLAKLRDIQEQKNTSTQAPELIPQVPSTCDVFYDVALTLGNSRKSEILTTLKSPRLQMSPKVFYFPGIEGNSFQFEVVAAQVNAHVLSFQYTEEVPSQTMQDLAQALLPHVLKSLPKSEPFKIMASSYGCLPALETAYILESKGYKGSIILINTSPEFLKNLILYNFNVQSEVEFETQIISVFLNFYLPPDKIIKVQEKLQNCKSWNDRVELGITEINQHTPINNVEYSRAIIKGFYQRIKFIVNYKPTNNKLISPVTLVRPTKAGSVETVNSYGLSSIIEAPIKVNAVETRHTISSNNAEIVPLINAWLKEV